MTNSSNPEVTGQGLEREVSFESTNNTQIGVDDVGVERKLRKENVSKKFMLVALLTVGAVLFFYANGAFRGSGERGGRRLRPQSLVTGELKTRQRGSRASSQGSGCPPWRRI